MAGGLVRLGPSPRRRILVCLATLHVLVPARSQEHLAHRLEYVHALVVRKGIGTSLGKKSLPAVLLPDWRRRRTNQRHRQHDTVDVR